MDEWDPDDDPTVVFDLGSNLISGGFTNSDTEPRAAFDTVVGTPIYSSRMLGMGHKENYVGTEAWSKCGMLKISRSIEHGKIVNEEHLTSVLQIMTYNCLGIAPDTNPLLITEHPQNPKENRETLIQILIEYFGWCGVYVAEPANLAAPYLKDGIAVDCGFGVTTVSPILDGKVLETDVIRQDFAGGDVSDAIINHLNNEGDSFFSSSDRYFITGAMNYPDNHCEYLGKSKTDSITNYLLPDGNKVSFGLESFYAPDILFNPRLINANKFVGIQDMIKKSISNCTIDEQALLLNNIVLMGGSTLYNNFPEQLNDKVSQLFPNSKIRIRAEKDRKYHTFLFGSLFTSDNRSKRGWITYEDYKEYGPNCIWGKKEQTEEIV